MRINNYRVQIPVLRRQNVATRLLLYVPSSITGSGAFRRFSKIGNEPIPVLDAAKIGNEKRNSIGNEPIPVLDAAQIGNGRTGNGHSAQNRWWERLEPVLVMTKTGSAWFNQPLTLPNRTSGHDQNRFWS